MAQIDKYLEKLYKKPVPNDMRVAEIEKIVRAFGCIVVSGGRHQMKIVHKPTGTVIPIPSHGDTVAEAYIKEIKKLIDRIKEEQQ